jgi:hypothetical protein
VDTETTASPRDPAASAAAAVGPASLVEAFRALLGPLAQLAVARGMPFASVDEELKAAYVEAARAAHPGVAAHRAVSRISAATGLNRREVTRLVQRDVRPVRARKSPATQVFTRWMSDPALRTPEGGPKPLPRQGSVPSFEGLAQSVTRDVHPRSLLEELCRLGLARVDETDGQVHLLRDAFVPRGDMDRMLGFLGANVGDHLSAAVANVLSDGSRHFEQALFADELSQHSLEEARALITAQWQSLLGTMVPALQGLIERDRAAGRPQDQRLRIGLYTYTEATRADASSLATPQENSP